MWNGHPPVWALLAAERANFDFYTKLGQKVFIVEDHENFPDLDYITDKKLCNIFCSVTEVEKLLRNIIWISMLQVKLNSGEFLLT